VDKIIETPAGNTKADDFIDQEDQAAGKSLLVTVSMAPWEGVGGGGGGASHRRGAILTKVVSLMDSITGYFPSTNRHLNLVEDFEWLSDPESYVVRGTPGSVSHGNRSRGREQIGRGGKIDHSSELSCVLG